MKRFIVILMTLCLLGSSICFAAGSEETSDDTAIAVSLDTIEQVWKDHSPEYLKINSDLDISKTTMDDLQDSYDDLNDYVFYDTTGLLWSQHSTLRDSLAKAKCAYATAQAQYQQKIEGKILTAKQALLTCRQDDLNVALVQEQLSEKQQELKNKAVSLQKNYISQSTYDDLAQTVSDLESTLDSLETQRQTDLLTLKADLGLDSDQAVQLTYPTFTEDELDGYMELNLETDLSEMLEASVDVQVKQITVDSMKANAYDTDEDMEGARLALDKAKTDAETNMRLKYQSLESLYSALKTSRSDRDQAKTDLDSEKKKLSSGYSSSYAVSQLQLSYDADASTVAGKELTFYSAYLSYLNMKAGY